MKSLKDLFFGITGVLALCADFIALYTYFKNPSPQNADLNLLLFVLSQYAWVALSWYFVRRSFMNGVSRKRFQRRFPVLRYSLLGFGLLTGIISGTLTYITQYPFLLIQIGSYPIAYGILFFLLPVVYEEMRVYIMRLGVYVCTNDLWTAQSSEFESILILSGETISVISMQRIKREIIPDHYYIRLKHQKGLLKSEDLLANFRVSKTRQS